LYSRLCWFYVSLFQHHEVLRKIFSPAAPRDVPIQSFLYSSRHIAALRHPEVLLPLFPAAGKKYPPEESVGEEILLSFSATFL